MFEVYPLPTALGEYRQCNKYARGQAATLALASGVKAAPAVDNVFVFGQHAP